MNTEEGFALAVALLLVGLFTLDVVTDRGWLDQSLDSAVPFSTVKPIFEHRCVSCHSDPHWNWTNYEVAYKRRALIKHRVWVLRNMPADRLISEDERKTIRDWVDDGGRP